MVLAKLKTRSLHFCRQADCTKFTYDTLLRMAGIKNANGGGTVLSQFTYTYDAVNRLTTEVLGGNTKTFTYDVRSQLTGDGTSTYGYDSAGNRNNSNGTLNNVGSNGNYWSSTVNGTNARNLNFNSSNANMNSNAAR